MVEMHFSVQGGVPVRVKAIRASRCRWRVGKSMMLDGGWFEEEWSRVGGEGERKGEMRCRRKYWGGKRSIS